MAASASAGGYCLMLGALLRFAIAPPLPDGAVAAGAVQAEEVAARRDLRGPGGRIGQLLRDVLGDRVHVLVLSTPANGGMLMPPCVDHRRDEAGEAGRRERRADEALALGAVAAGAVLGEHAAAACPGGYVDDGSGSGVGAGVNEPGAGRRSHAGRRGLQRRRRRRGRGGERGHGRAASARTQKTTRESEPRHGGAAVPDPRLHERSAHSPRLPSSASLRSPAPSAGMHVDGVTVDTSDSA